MTRDYKPTARPRKAPARGSGGSLLVGVLIGLLLGLAIALGVALYLNKMPGPFVSRTKPPEAQPAKPEAAKAPEPAQAKGAEKAPPADEKSTRFDFYKILPGSEEPGTERKPKEIPAPTAPAAGDQLANDSKDAFFLQAGAFQSAADADNLKARLALMGIEAVVQTATIPDKGTMHRVRAGPYTRVEDVNRARETLKQNGIDTTLIKIRDGQ